MKNKLRSYQTDIDAYLAQCFLEDAPQKELFESMRYSLLAGGKRLRGALCLAFCELCGGKASDAMEFAAAVEMVHCYSLIHDDLPSMDNDDFRRGKPTNHRVYGEAKAILAGDGLLTAAFHRLSMARLPAERIVKAVSTLAFCAGELGMVGGQILDMDAEQRPCTAQDVYDIQSRKTGALICAACLLGVIAAGGTKEQEQAADQYARSLGLAFQIRDDILDVVGDAEKLGKATGADDKKNTFVRIYGVARCEEMVSEETEKAIESLRSFDAPEFLIAVAREMEKRDH
ncbi:MAG: polyprenyl synthetase family protein [Oscillospiraceae bacterium]|nr:polyprenyl synthetase family protein [Oscillospiraceae bacterium]